MLSQNQVAQVYVDIQGAGVATYGDLTPLLESQDLYTINYGLESVKILDGNGANEDKNFGYITSNAVSISEIGHPNRKRIFVMPVTTLEAEHGKPTAWSSSIDALCADSTTEVLEQKNPRLFILAAGNLDKRINSLQFSYPTENEKQEVANPAQAWNAISVGAITYKVKIDEVSSYSPVANLGELSPHSTTSVSDTWDSNMPLKPEIVFEGGNCGEDAFSKSTLTSLSLLTTYYNFTDRLFSSFNATSAASAMAANFAIKILSKYPNIWPETIRGLMVHSAEWNKALRYQFGSDLLEGNGEVLGSKTKEFARRMRKRVGFGEPNLNNALNSFRSSAVVILEEEFQPYRKGKNSIGSNLLQVDLPWPKEEIQNLLTLQVKLKVTLSYFIEPNPSGQAAGRYSYPSHQLKFDLKRANESAENFLARIDENTKNKMLESDRLIQKVDHDKWFFGIDARSKGSIQKDVWIGSATELADRDVLVIFPTTGWWKTRTKLRRFNSKTRISLIVSLEALNPEIDIDLYTSIQNKVDSMVKVKASVVV
ncbi:hypothetical protein RP300_01347 [Oligella urethralis]|uniref:S8 family peptidase n=1 Tax=Oligella urethralis TaxID=90245 RepID=UPI002958B6CB|nr:S8 family peptidase [Oligella urethralis]WOS37794.1 hypothetical protein RP300_01347 [Oligella urethralis]